MRASLIMLSQSEASGRGENRGTLLRARPFDCGLRVAMVMMLSQSGVVSWLTTESYAVTG